MNTPMMPGIASHISTRLSGRDGLDFLPTPPWALRALIDHLFHGQKLKGSVWEPACGKMDMAMPLRELMEPGEPLICSDIVDRGSKLMPLTFVTDFLSDDPLAQTKADWIITNPPFAVGHAFILKALKQAYNVAMLVRTNFLEGVERYHDLFSKTPPTRTLQFVERVPMFADRLDPDGSTMTAYMWLVWLRGSYGENSHSGWLPRRPVEWIAPCRKRLEKPGDYDQYISIPLFEPQVPLFEEPEEGTL